jgi:hypothetical protein
MEANGLPENMIVADYATDYWERLRSNTHALDTKAAALFTLAASFLGVLVSGHIEVHIACALLAGMALLLSTMVSLVAFLPRDIGTEADIQQINTCLSQAHDAKYENEWDKNPAGWTIGGYLQNDISQYLHEAAHDQKFINRWKAREVARAGFLLIVALLIGMIGMVIPRFSERQETTSPSGPVSETPESSQSSSAVLSEASAVSASQPSDGLSLPGGLPCRSTCGLFA